MNRPSLNDPRIPALRKQLQGSAALTNSESVAFPLTC